MGTDVPGDGGWGGGATPENDFCIKMGSDVSHLKFHSLQGGSHKTVFIIHTF